MIRLAASKVFSSFGSIGVTSAMLVSMRWQLITFFHVHPRQHLLRPVVLRELPVRRSLTRMTVSSVSSKIITYVPTSDNIRKRRPVRPPDRSPMFHVNTVPKKHPYLQSTP